jgi:DNA-binding NarL/FixJ family response regulator
MMAALRIFIADDHEVVRKGLGALLQAESGWEICGEAADGRTAVEKVHELRPDVIILDIGMPALNGLEATRQIIKDNPRARVLILTLHDADQVVRDVLGAGARGFLLKSDAARDLVVAVDALLRDKTYFTSKVAAMVLEGYLKGGAPEAAISLGRHQLTPREREVVQMLAEGKSSKEVAVALGLSVKTAETHRSNIMRKLQLHSVSDLVLYAVRNNIVHVVQAGVE